ncbi:DNA adenine methylase [Fusobacterium nucleatum]|uniref:Cytosine methyltransferase n=1 Tax=Fusobacterium nucleatum subsp. polymorphum TaxID=76857 RepID=A0A2C6AW54_FUSNP|nr:DNA adenine methylase [Fusobacterium polymorphum]PHH97517.1 cytosine methyltransferase [Fusobacterium polymorphum]
MKIQKPFKYMGSKGRFYNEIKEIFLLNKKNTYVDLFAGGMEIAVNLKEDIKDLKVTANVKDEHIESFLKCNKMAIKKYNELVNFLYKDIEKISSRFLFADKEKWQIIKNRYKEFWNDNKLNFSEDERKMVELLASMNKGYSLSNSFFSIQKMEKIKIYLKKLKNIDITHNYFNESWSYKDNFILLDPPYLCGTEVVKIGKKGYNYSNIWTEKDDARLVKFIKNNLKNNNVFMIFGSLENNLSKLLQKAFNVDFVVKKYKKSIFGISLDRAEWYCIIK